MVWTINRSTSRSPPAMARLSVMGLRTPTDSGNASFTPRKPTPGSVSSLLYFNALPGISWNGRVRRTSEVRAYISTIADRSTSPGLSLAASTMVNAIHESLAGTRQGSASAETQDATGQLGRPLLACLGSTKGTQALDGIGNFGPVLPLARPAMMRRGSPPGRRTPEMRGHRLQRQSPLLGAQGTNAIFAVAHFAIGLFAHGDAVLIQGIKDRHAALHEIIHGLLVDIGRHAGMQERRANAVLLPAPAQVFGRAFELLRFARLGRELPFMLRLHAFRAAQHEGFNPLFVVNVGIIEPLDALTQARHLAGLNPLELDLQLAAHLLGVPPQGALLIQGILQSCDIFGRRIRLQDPRPVFLDIVLPQDIGNFDITLKPLTYGHRPSRSLASPTHPTQAGGTKKGRTAPPGHTWDCSTLIIYGCRTRSPLR